MNHRSVSRTVTILLLALLAGAGVLVLLLPFFGPLLFAFIVAVTFYPLYDWFSWKTPRLSPNWRALAVDLAILACLIVPTGLLSWAAVEQAQGLPSLFRQAGAATQAIREGRLHPTLEWARPLRAAVARATGMSLRQAQAWLFGRANQAIDYLRALATRLAGSFIRVMAHLVFGLFILFFFLRDGRRYVAEARRFLPLPDEDEAELFGRVQDAIVAIMRGWFLTAIVQGVSATVGFLVTGAGPAALLGVLVSLCSLIPVFGTSLVWAPIAIGLLAKGAYWQGLFLLCWGGLMVGTIDNVLAPWLVGHRMRMGLLPLLFAILGGIAVFGFKGLVLGPLIISVAPTVFGILRRRVIGPAA